MIQLNIAQITEILSVMQKRSTQKNGAVKTKKASFNFYRRGLNIICNIKYNYTSVGHHIYANNMRKMLKCSADCECGEFGAEII